MYTNRHNHINNLGCSCQQCCSAIVLSTLGTCQCLSVADSATELHLWPTCIDSCMCHCWGSSIWVRYAVTNARFDAMHLYQGTHPQPIHHTTSTHHPPTAASTTNPQTHKGPSMLLDCQPRSGVGYTSCQNCSSIERLLSARETRQRRAVSCVASSLKQPDQTLDSQYVLPINVQGSVCQCS